MFGRSFAKQAAITVAILASAVMFGTHADAQNALFSRVSSAADSGARTDLVASIAARPTTKTLELVRVNTDALSGNSVSIELRNAEAAVASKQRIFRRGSNDYTWIGQFPDGGNAILVVKDGEITGQVVNGTNAYEIQPIGNGVHALIGIEPRQFPSDHPTPSPPSRGGDARPLGDASAPIVTSADGIQVDVLIVYTTDAKNAYGGNMTAFAQASVDAANVAYANSNANVSMRLVGTREIGYAQNDFSTALTDLTTGSDADMVAVRAQRDQVGADVVSLMINNGSSCGLGYVNSTATYATSVVHYACAISNHSFAHEVGHNFGSLHDPYVDPSNNPYAYGHGYIKPGSNGATGWRTIMAYGDGCNFCARLQYFSSPDVIYSDGAPMGTAATHDNARVHRERVSTVAGFRATVVPNPPAGSPKAHDFDGDGRSDVLWRESAGYVSMWLMNGGTIQQNISLGNVPPSWAIVGQRDFNGDGRYDILWREAAGYITMWQMNGSAIVQNLSLGNIPPNWSIVGTADFGGDGKGDILWREQGGAVTIWQMNGSSIAQNTSLGVVPTNWTIAGTGDFNGDGKADILWREASGYVTIWQMNGDAIAQNTNVGFVPSNWSIVGTGDFNGDGKADILWRDNAGNVTIWVMNGTSIQQNVSIGNVPTSWIITQTGDYNGDGKFDIVWRETGGGYIAIWQMNGAAIQQNVSVGSVPTNWVIQGAGAD